MLGVLQLHVRVAEMQLEPVPKIPVLRASLEFAKSIIFEGIEAAKRPEALRKQGGLGAHPVILLLNLRVFVLRLAPGPPVRRRTGQENGAPDAGRVQQPDDVLSRDRLYLLELRHGRAE